KLQVYISIDNRVGISFDQRFAQYTSIDSSLPGQKHYLKPVATCGSRIRINLEVYLRYFLCAYCCGSMQIIVFNGSRNHIRKINGIELQDITSFGCIGKIEI